MLLELAIGDAYGAGFEYANSHYVRAGNDLSSYRQHPKHRLKPGCYTDDTQMSVAITEMILSAATKMEIMLFNLVLRQIRRLLARCFLLETERDVREGYANRFYEFLRSVSDGQEFLERIEPHSDKSGAAMRAVPIGVYDTMPRSCSCQRYKPERTPRHSRWHQRRRDRKAKWDTSQNLLVTRNGESINAADRKSIDGALLFVSARAKARTWRISLEACGRPMEGALALAKSDQKVDECPDAAVTVVQRERFFIRDSKSSHSIHR